MPRELAFIIIHHSYSVDHDYLDWSGIRNYHTSHRVDSRIVTPDEFQDLKRREPKGHHFEEPWGDIGYHFGIEKVGGSYETLLGRPLQEPGAHCIEMRMNWKSVGICVTGNFDLAPPEEGALKRLEALCRWLCPTFRIPVMTGILGHREVGKLAGFDWERGQYKSCPGKLFPLAEFRARLL